MNICILLALVYIIGGVGILIMKKLQPEDKIYPVYLKNFADCLDDKGVKTIKVQG